MYQGKTKAGAWRWWERHLATAADDLYIATHRGVQLGMGVALDAVRQQALGHG